jgi:hypothetical protein
MFLNKEELADLTGYKNRKKQIQWLAENGIKFLISGVGEPKVLKSAIEELLGAGDSQKRLRKRVEPNWDAI